MLEQLGWVAIALGALGAKTGMGYYQKKIIDTDISALKVGMAWTVIGSLLFIPAGVYDFVTHSYTISDMGILALAIVGVAEVLKSVIGLKALETADLSTVAPIRKSYIVVLALVEPFVFAIGFQPILLLSTVLAAIGVFLVISEPGATRKESLSRLTDRGPMFAVISGLITVILSLGSRFGATTLSPLAFGAVVYFSLALGYLIWIRLEEKSIPWHIFKQYQFHGLGVLAITQSFLTWTTFSLVPATVASTFFQLTVLTITLAGLKGLNEKNPRRKIVGSCILLVGVLLVVLTTT